MRGFDIVGRGFCQSWNCRSDGKRFTESRPPSCMCGWVCMGIARCDTAACLLEGIILDSNSTSVVST